MSTPHTEGRVTFREDGDANHWSMLAEDGRWLLALLHNGEAPSERQVANFLRLAACWNACQVITDPENVVPRLLALNERVPDLEHQAATLRVQRDELLAALERIADPRNKHFAGDAKVVSCAAIAKVKGGSA